MTSPTQLAMMELFRARQKRRAPRFRQILAGYTQNERTRFHSQRPIDRDLHADLRRRHDRLGVGWRAGRRWWLTSSQNDPASVHAI
jgi:hypothetical protein